MTFDTLYFLNFGLIYVVVFSFFFPFRIGFITHVHNGLPSLPELFYMPFHVDLLIHSFIFLSLLSAGGINCGEYFESIMITRGVCPIGTLI